MEIPQKIDTNTRYISATVVRELSPKVYNFHKYRRVSSNPNKIAGFIRAVEKIHLHDGKVIHINFYNRETGGFLFRIKVQ